MSIPYSDKKIIVMYCKMTKSKLLCSYIFIMRKGIAMKDNNGSVQPIDRVLDIFETLSAAPQGLTLSDLAAATSLHVSTAHRLLASLANRGYVRKDAENGKYRLTLRIYEISRRVSTVLNLFSASKPLLEKLSNDVKEIVHLVERDGNEVVYLHKFEPLFRPISITSSVGLHNPMYCTGVGKSIMAYLPEKEVRAIWDGTQVIPFTPKTITTSTPTYFQDGNGNYIYGFMQDDTGEKLYTAVQSAVDAARKEGAKYVIAMAHLGIEADCQPWTSSDVIVNTSGIDVVLDGHSHSTIAGDIVKNKEGKDVILTSTGTKLANIGCLTITADGKLSTALINDDGMGDTIAEIKSGYEEIVNTVVASTKVELTVNDPVSGERMVRRQETNLGDLCADAYRAMSGADIAVVNGGGIRVSIPAGDITYGQIIAVHPFGNEMCVVEATGQQILDALEMGARNAPGECGGFLQVSGMSYEIDLNVEPTVEVNADGMFTGVSGEYRVKNVKVGDEPLDLAKTYTLASHNYMLKSAGDGMAMFQGCTLLQDSVMIDNQVLINYIVDVLGGVVGEDYADPYGQGRITVIEKK